MVPAVSPAVLPAVPPASFAPINSPATIDSPADGGVLPGIGVMIDSLQALTVMRSKTKQLNGPSKGKHLK